MRSRTIAGATVAAVLAGLGIAYLTVRSGADHGAVAPLEPPEVEPAATVSATPKLARRAMEAPRFTAPPKKAPAVVTRPGSKGYDPLKLVQLGTPAEDVFAAEPRDVKWAEVIEPRLQKQLASDLAIMVPGASVTEVTCHSSTCRIDFQAPEADGDRASRAVQLVPFSDATAFSFESDNGIFKGTMHLLYGDSRDPAVQMEHYAQARSERLRDMVPGQGRLEGIREIPRQ